jgi:hypothetical protein
MQHYYFNTHSLVSQDKVSKNMKFNQFFQKTLVSEISQSVIDKLPYNLQQELSKNKMSFNKIFGNQLRLIEPLRGTSQYGETIRNLLSDDFEFDFEKWTGTKLTDKDKKNPTRIGKLLNNKKRELLKKISDLQEELKTPPKTEVVVFHHSVKSGWIEKYKIQIKEIDDLLKVNDLQKAHISTTKSQYSIIYSRVPVDVVRMSDFSWRSCHSEGGDYFYCALADAVLNAGIAYLVDTQQLIQFAGGQDKIQSFLQQDEIFKDSKRAISGIQPLARIRIRNVIDSQGNSIAVPSTKIYKDKDLKGVDETFKDQVLMWAKKQDVSNYEWEDTLTLKGGSYQDANVDVKTMIKKIWGKDISYDVSEDEDEFRDEQDEENDHIEEQFWDNVREEIDVEKIFRDALGRDYEENFTVDLNLYNGELKLEYDLSGEFLEFLSKKSTNLDKKTIRLQRQTTAYDKNFTVFIDPKNRKDIQFTSVKSFVLYDYDHDVQTGYFDYRGFVYSIEKYIESVISAFLEESYDVSHPQYLRAAMNKKIAKYYDIEFPKYDEEKVSELIAWHEQPELFHKTILPKLDYKLTRANDGYNLDFNLKQESKQYVLETIDNMENFLYHIINKEYKNLYENNYIVTLKKTLFIKRPENISSDVNARSFTIGMDKQGYDKLKVVVDSYSKVDYIEYKIAIVLESDLNKIIDDGSYLQWLDALYFLRDEVAPEIQDKKTVEELENYTKKFIKDEYLKKQGQMDLDLSSINRNMKNKFDLYIQKIWTESLANMGTGGLSNRSGANTPSSSSYGTSSSTTSNTQTSQTKPIFSKDKKNKMNVSSIDMDNMLLNPQTKLDDVLKDKDNQNSILTYISSSMSDPNYKNKEKIQNLIKNNKNLSDALSKFIIGGAK